ncbi:hypothetical protein BC832DRAFT_539475 [Gaertneriomyces semiglobifer]|nr:hypothetical protein BC832DRAFT_539475 [Gaertneriomyces semiglobifer]
MVAIQTSESVGKVILVISVFLQVVGFATFAAWRGREVIFRNKAQHLSVADRMLCVSGATFTPLVWYTVWNGASTQGMVLTMLGIGAQMTTAVFNQLFKLGVKAGEMAIVERNATGHIDGLDLDKMLDHNMNHEMHYGLVRNAYHYRMGLTNGDAPFYFTYGNDIVRILEDTHPQVRMVALSNVPGITLCSIPRLEDNVDLVQLATICHTINYSDLSEHFGWIPGQCRVRYDHGGYRPWCGVEENTLKLPPTPETVYTFVDFLSDVQRVNSTEVLLEEARVRVGATSAEGRLTHSTPLSENDDSDVLNWDVRVFSFNYSVSAAVIAWHNGEWGVVSSPSQVSAELKDSDLGIFRLMSPNDAVNVAARHNAFRFCDRVLGRRCGLQEAGPLATLLGIIPFDCNHTRPWPLTAEQNAWRVLEVTRRVPAVDIHWSVFAIVIAHVGACLIAVGTLVVAARVVSPGAAWALSQGGVLQLLGNNSTYPAHASDYTSWIAAVGKQDLCVGIEAHQGKHHVVMNGWTQPVPDMAMCEDAAARAIPTATVSAI